MTLDVALTGGTETSVDVDAIPSDTPSSGTIRVELASGKYKRVPYTSYAGSTFTISSTSFTGDNAAISNNVWISYVDDLADATTEAFTSVYSTDRDLVVKVRDGGGSPIKEFISSASLGSNGGSITAIRTGDV